MTAATEKLLEALDEIEKAQQSLVNTTDLITDALDLLDDSGTGGGGEPNEDEYFGGPVGVGGKRVVENKTFQQTDLEEYKDTDLVNCTFTKALYDITLPKNLRLLSCKLQGLKAPSDDKDHVFYVNNGHSETQVNFVMDDCLLEGCKAGNLMEFKASEIYIFRLRQHDCQTSSTIRQRHGRMLVVGDCEGLGPITVRGWGHYIKDCPGAKVTLYSGNLPARYEQWKDMHISGGGGNFQCAELVYLEGVGPILLGKESLENKPDDYPALDCIIGPNCGEVTKLIHKGTDFDSTLQSHLDLWDICGLTPTGGAKTV